MNDSLFNMQIKDILYLRERGLIIVGQIEHGGISIGDKVRFETIEGKVVRNNIELSGLEFFDRVAPDSSNKGINAGLFFKIPYIKSKEEGIQALPVKIGDIVKK